MDEKLDLIQKISNMVRDLEESNAKLSRDYLGEKSRREAAENRVGELLAAKSKLEAILSERRTVVEEEVIHLTSISVQVQTSKVQLIDWSRNPEYVATQWRYIVCVILDSCSLRRTTGRL